MGRLHSYVVEHDYGFAPNPFWGVCTLGFCKPLIRKAVSQGDILIGTGSSADDNIGRLVYWMKVGGIYHFDDYWNDPAFRMKKPVLNGSKAQHFGDNIYHTGLNGVVCQLDSFHSQEDGLTSMDNLLRDVGSTPRVLIGTEFAYFGKAAPVIPEQLSFAVKIGRGHKNRFSIQDKEAVISWLLQLPRRGFVEEPTRW